MADPDSNDHDSTVDYSDSNMSETADGPRDLREENEYLKAEINRLACKVMKLQYTADHITDGEIGTGVERLQDAIQWWIVGVEKDLRKQSREFRRAFSQVLNRRDDMKLVVRELGFGDGTSHEADIMWMRWLGDLTTCSYIVLGRTIWLYLEKKIFSERYPTGVSEDSACTFDDILSVMKRGDEDQVLLANKWRSDAVSALVTTDAFQSRKGRMVKKLAAGLVKHLGFWIDSETLERHRNTLEINLIQRSIDLHEKIACSSYEYRIITPDLARGEIPDESKLSSWTLKDTVRLMPIYDNIAVFQCLYPGIYRREMPGEEDEEDEEDVPAAPPVVLVYDHTSPKIPSGPIRRSQPPKVLQQGPGRQQTIQRSPRPSPERKVPPTLEDPGSARQAQHMANAPIMSTILNVFGQSSSRKKRAKTPSSSSRNRPSEPNNHSSIDRKRSKSKSRSRPQSVSIPSSPIKPTPTYKAEEVSQVTSTDLSSGQGLSNHGEYEEILRVPGNAHDEWEDESDNETFVNEYGAIERRFKHRSNPFGLPRRPETGSMYGT